MIHYLPIEHLEQRYTKHLDSAIRSYLKASGVEHRVYYPDIEERPILNGSFLDAPTTIEFKSTQIAMLAAAFGRGEVRDGDMVFCSDLWMPGIESLAYLNFFTKKDVKLRGIMHAGSWTDTDFVRTMERWAKGFEEAVLDIAETVFVASQFSKKELVSRRMVNPDKVQVTPFPLDPAASAQKMVVRNHDIVFNGRMCDEKQPMKMYELSTRLLQRKCQYNLRFTQRERLTKEEYHKVIGRARVVVSFARQENFGFGINEAVAAGCVPVMPNRLVYPEFYGERYLYNTMEECADLVEAALNGTLKAPDLSFKADDSIARWFQ